MLRLPSFGRLETDPPQPLATTLREYGCAARHPRLLVHSQTETQPPCSLLMQSEEVGVSACEQLGCGK